MDLPTQVNELSTRVLAMEQMERKSSYELLTLTREKMELVLKVENCTRTCEELRTTVNSNRELIASLQSKTASMDNMSTKQDRMESETKKLKQKNAELENTVAGLLTRVQSQEKIQEQITELNKIRQTLNRAMAQGYEEQKTKANVKDSEEFKELEKKMDDFVTWKTGRIDKEREFVERLRSMDRRLGAVQAVEDKIRALHSWKSEKEGEFNALCVKVNDLKESGGKNAAAAAAVKKRSGSDSDSDSPDIADAVGKLLTIKLLEQHQDTSNSVFCAQVFPPQPLKKNELVRFDNCETILQNSNGYFSQPTGLLNPQEEGIYNLSWKIHQRGEGKINYLLNVEGVSGMIYLGFTDQTGDVCSGCLLMPLKEGQSVSLVAKKMTASDARVMSCNFMGWLLDKCNLPPKNKITGLQESLFRPLKNDCQHL